MRSRGTSSAYRELGPAVSTLDELRAKLKVFESFGYKASAKELRRRIRALERGQDPDAPQITEPPRPRKRVKWSRLDSGGRYRVRMVCGHMATVNGVACKGGLGHRAPFTAVCPICNP